MKLRYVLIASICHRLSLIIRLYRPLVPNYCKSVINWLWSIIDRLAVTDYRSWNCNRFPTLVASHMWLGGEFPLHQWPVAFLISLYYVRKRWWNKRNEKGHSSTMIEKDCLFCKTPKDPEKWLTHWFNGIDLKVLSRSFHMSYNTIKKWSQH